MKIPMIATLVASAMLATVFSACGNNAEDPTPTPISIVPTTALVEQKIVSSITEITPTITPIPPTPTTVADATRSAENKRLRGRHCINSDKFHDLAGTSPYGIADGDLRMLIKANDAPKTTFPDTVARIDMYEIDSENFGFDYIVMEDLTPRYRGKDAKEIFRMRGYGDIETCELTIYDVVR